MAIIEATRALKTWAGHYDFDQDGGVEGTIELRSDDGPIPVGSVITGGYLEVVTALDSGGMATAALQVEAANDTVTQAAFDDAAWGEGENDIIPDATGSATLKTTDSRSPALVIGTADLTAGVFNLVLFYR